jgi:CheY-like chemotaxis protein
MRGMTQYSELKDKRILVVEDVELNQYLARHIMESWGCVVEVVENGSLAVERISDADYDLVLMDIQMPVMDGIQATKLIRRLNDDYKSSTPIVALTANSMRSECENYLRVGMNDWLGKPFQEPALFATVSKNIRKDQKMRMSERVVAEEAVATVNVELKLYDLSMVEAISGGDTSFVNRMLLLFLETVPATLTDLSSAADSGEWLALSKVAHKLKSTIDSMQILSLKPVIREVESGGKTGEDPAGLRERVKIVLEVMNKVIEDVRRQT